MPCIFVVWKDDGANNKRPCEGAASNFVDAEDGHLGCFFGCVGFVFGLVFLFGLVGCSFGGFCSWLFGGRGCFFWYGDVVNSIAVKIFAGETSGLTRAFTKIGEIVAADLGTADNFDFFDKGRMNEVGFLDADAGSNLADYDAGGVGFFAVDTNHDAFKSLEAEFAAFLDFLSDSDGVTGPNIYDGLFLLCVADLF